MGLLKVDDRVYILYFNPYYDWSKFI